MLELVQANASLSCCWVYSVSGDGQNSRVSLRHQEPHLERVLNGRAPDGRRRVRRAVVSPGDELIFLRRRGLRRAVVVGVPSVHELHAGTQNVRRRK